MTTTHTSEWITPREAREALVSGTGRGIKIALLDSGVELSHPAFAGRRLVDDVAFEIAANGVVHRVPGRGEDVSGHATALAGAIWEVAPEAQIGSFRVLDRNYAGKYAIIREAATLAIEAGYHALNCSFGSRAEERNIGHFKPWVDLAYRRGVHVVSACNNQSFREAEWPGNFPTVVSVNMARTSSPELHLRWDEARGGGSRHLVEFAARGVGVELPWKNGSFAARTGSSFAAAHTAGLLARLLSVYPALKPMVALALLQEVATAWTPSIAGPNG